MTDGLPVVVAQNAAAFRSGWIAVPAPASEIVSSANGETVNPGVETICKVKESGSTHD